MVYAAAAAAAPPVDWAAFDDPARSTKLATAYPQVDRVMREFVARENVPGAAWGIVVDGRLAHLGTTGLRDVEGARPVQGDSVFRIASMTKSFTAMAILKLRDEIQSAKGPAFSLKAFHDELISFGDLPFTQIRRLMLRQ